MITIKQICKDALVSTSTNVLNSSIDFFLLLSWLMSLLTFPAIILSHHLCIVCIITSF